LVDAALDPGHVTVSGHALEQFESGLWRLADAHSEFSDAVSRARAARVLWLEQKLLRSRKGAETTAAIFALKNAAPDEWRDIKTTEHKHSVDVRSLTDAQLYAIAGGADPSEIGVIEGEFERIGEKPATH
jgi:hypothetical protein